MEIWIDGAVRGTILFKSLASRRSVANAMVRATMQDIVSETRNKRATMQAQVNKLQVIKLNQEIANKLQLNKLVLNQEIANKLQVNKLVVNQEIANNLLLNQEVGHKEGAT